MESRTGNVSKTVDALLGAEAAAHLLLHFLVPGELVVIHSI